jgi:hypothetical protein
MSSLFGLMPALVILIVFYRCSSRGYSWFSGRFEPIGVVSVWVFVVAYFVAGLVAFLVASLSTSGGVVVVVTAATALLIAAGFTDARFRRVPSPAAWVTVLFTWGGLLFLAVSSGSGVGVLFNVSLLFGLMLTAILLVGAFFGIMGASDYRAMLAVTPALAFLTISGFAVFLLVFLVVYVGWVVRARRRGHGVPMVTVLCFAFLASMLATVFA